ncbi:GMP/IMP nucleotidase [Pelomicrobium sp.]|jgi:HAD superfamily hydrolase (TIGR01509 family)|uniref:GMP/IMP nucleotidase n=1 Tax=Pelomicrobium sp. TaxID=2815319 RepID=UPI002FDD53D3
MIAWDTVDTVLLDMDGTLLDLNFDNHFWLTHVPRRYAEKHGLSLQRAREDLIERYRRKAGTLDWYCVDYWTRELGLDIARLKAEVEHLIAVHPHVVPFLMEMRSRGKQTVLVTNAHQKSLELKLKRTGLGRYLDGLVCSHGLGLPKEAPGFWRRLQALKPFDPERTVLVDDSLPVLRSARDFGIRYLVAVRRPDSAAREIAVTEFDSVASFADLLPG